MIERRENGPGLLDAVKALALAVVLAILIDSVLIIVVFAAASMVVRGLSGDGGFIVFLMAVSLVVTWPMVAIPLGLVLLGRRLVVSMPVPVFAIGFAGSVTAAFYPFMYETFFSPRVGFVAFATSVTMTVDAGLAFLVAATFAILFRTLLPAHRP